MRVQTEHRRYGSAIKKSSVRMDVLIVLAITVTLLSISVFHMQAAPNAVSSIPAEPSAANASSTGGPAVYDELLGITFTQNSSSLEYNVTAVAQNDSYGYGPVYLVNGLSNTGFWYQVGLSWDWPSGNGHVNGFNMNYEVFDNNDDIVFPPLFGGGISSFSGPVNQGDSVQLSLYFLDGSVVMQAFDWNTGANASMSYSANGATFFCGLQDERSNSQGFFTGLMTEKYNVDPYYSDQWSMKPQQFNGTTALTSACIWMEEFNATPDDPLFIDYTFLNFSSPQQLQYFSSHGTTSAADAYDFITGLATEQQPVTFSCQVQGGNAALSPPVLTYISNGGVQKAELGADQRTFYLDNGSSWSINPTVGGSPYERWESNQTNGTAISKQTVNITYYDQYLITFFYSVQNDSFGSMPSAPIVNFWEFGNLSSATAGNPEWVDAAAPYIYENPVNGSSVGERWFTNSPDGTASLNATVNVVYYPQYYIQIEANTYNGGSVLQKSGWFDIGTNITLTATASGGWKLQRWRGIGPGSYTGSENNVTLTVDSAMIETAVFYQPFLGYNSAVVTAIDVIVILAIVISSTLLRQLINRDRTADQRPKQ